MKTKPTKEKTPASSSKVDTELCLELVARILTKDVENPMDRNSYRLQYLKNFFDINQEPGKHLSSTLFLINKHGASFDAGLQLGLCIALASRGGKSKSILIKMLDEIKEFQEKEFVQANASQAV